MAMLTFLQLSLTMLIGVVLYAGFYTPVLEGVQTYRIPASVIERFEEFTGLTQNDGDQFGPGRSADCGADGTLGLYHHHRVPVDPVPRTALAFLHRLDGADDGQASGPARSGARCSLGCRRHDSGACLLSCAFLVGPGRRSRHRTGGPFLACGLESNLAKPAL